MTLALLIFGGLALVGAVVLANSLVKRRRRRALHVRLVMDPIRKLHL